MSRFRDLMRYKKRINRWHFRISPDGEPATFNSYFGYARNIYTSDQEIITSLEYLEADLTGYKCYINDQLVLPDAIVNPGDVVRLERRRRSKEYFTSLGESKVNICEIIDPCPNISPNTNALFYNCKFLKSVNEDLFINLRSYLNLNLLYAFQKSGLEVIPDNLFRELDLRNCYGLFADTPITEYPEFLFDKVTYSIDGLFSKCSKLQSTKKLFANVSTAACRFVFNECISLTDVAHDTFYDNIATNYRGVFKYTSSLKRIDDRVFNEATSQDLSLWEGFSYSGLESVPSNLFKNTTGLTNLEKCFYYCKDLVSVGEGLFNTCTNLQNLSATFAFTPSLKRVPNGIFNPIKNSVTDVSYIFRKSRLEFIEDRVFADCPKLGYRHNAFYGTYLTKTPNEVFANSGNECSYIQYVSVNSVFADTYHALTSEDYSKGITEITEDVFKGIHPEIKSAKECFSSSSATETQYKVPPIFKYFVGLVNAEKCFYKAYGVTEIDEDLFANCPNLTNVTRCFEDTFANNVEGQKIPENLFKHNPKITSFYGTFADIGTVRLGRVEVPQGLFANHPEATDFREVFSCAHVTLRSDMFDNNPNIEQVDEAFKACMWPLGEMNGTAPALWERSNITSFKDCFKDQNVLTNYASIPNNWKGL